MTDRISNKRIAAAAALEDLRKRRRVPNTINLEEPPPIVIRSRPSAVKSIIVEAARPPLRWPLPERRAIKKAIVDWSTESSASSSDNYDYSEESSE